MPIENHALTAEQAEQFRRDGFLGPFEICSAAEMRDIRGELEASVLSKGSPHLPSNVHQSRHLDKRVVYDLCAHPAVIGRMAGVYGPDLLLWRSNFFQKEPGAKEIPWHQDMNYWPIEPPVNISAWIAIDEATLETSCVRLIPGSHKASVPHVRAEREMQFGEMADPAYVEAERAEPMELRPGQFFLFTERTLHQSEPNRSDQRRLGLAVRVTVPFVRVESRRLFRGHYNILVSGEDRAGINRLGDPPPSA